MNTAPLGKLYDGYLNRTILRGARPLIIGGVALTAMLLGIFAWKMSFVSVWFLVWGCFHLCTSAFELSDPIGTGLRFLYPRLYEEEGAAGRTKEALGRAVPMFELLFGSVRVAFAFDSHSVPLYIVTWITVLMQAIVMTREAHLGTADIRAASMGMGGAAILGAVLLAHAAMGGLGAG